MDKNNKNKNSGVIMYFLGKLAPALLGFSSIYLITKKLSPEQYGEYSLIVLILLFLQFFGSWVNQAIFYYLPKIKDEDFGMSTWFGQITFYIAIFGSFLAIFGFLISGVKYNIAFAAGLVFLSQIYWNYLSTYYQSREKPKIQLVATLFQVAIQISFLFFLFYFDKLTIFTAIIAIFLGFFAGNLWYIKSGIYKKRIIKISGVSIVNFKRYTKLTISYSGPLCMWLLFCQIYTFSDRFLLKWAGLSTDLGKYSATRDLLLGVVSIFAMPLLMVAHPMIMRIWSERKAAIEIEEIIQKNLTIIFIIGMFFLMILLGYGNMIFSIFLSSKYKLRNIDYVLMVAAILFSVTSMYAHKALEVTGATSKVAILGMGVAIFSVLSNLFFVKQFGLLSVEIVGLLSQMFYFFGATFLSKEYWSVSIPVRRFFLIIITVFLIYFLCKLIDIYIPFLKIYNFSIPIGLIVGTIFSFFAILCFKEIRDLFGDLHFLKKK